MPSRIEAGATIGNPASNHIAPHYERVQRIRSWHIERATSDVRPVAMLAVHITEHGQLHSDAIGIEPEMAGVIAAELLILAEQLKAMAVLARPTLSLVK